MLVKRARSVSDSHERRLLYNRAAAKCHDALKINEDQPLVRYILGNIYFDHAAEAKPKVALEFFEKAEEELGQAVEMKPDLAEALHDLAYVLWVRWEADRNDAQNRAGHARAEELMLKAESLKPGLCAYNLACWYAQQSRLEDTRRWLTEAVRLRTIAEPGAIWDDPDLVALHDQPWFSALASELEVNRPYIMPDVRTEVER
jgi:tetratricopeptide (TPR) repeat protein